MEDSRMYRPNSLTSEQKAEEAELVRNAIKRSGYTQSEIAQFIGTKQTAISPWLSSTKPNAIPDWQFLRLADVLGFNPANTRPWLYEMYIISERVFSNPDNAPKSAAETVLNIVSTMTPDEAIKVTGAIEAAVRAMRKTSEL